MKSNFLTKETLLQEGVYDRKFPAFRIGDTVKVAQIIKEGDKERIQMFEGDVIAMHKNGIATTFTVRRIGANGIGVERIFPYYAPFIKDIKLVKRGDVRRAKLYYIRERVGKAARVKEKIVSRAAENKTATEKKQQEENSSTVELKERNSSANETNK